MNFRQVVSIILKEGCKHCAPICDEAIDEDKEAAKDTDT